MSISRIETSELEKNLDVRIKYSARDSFFKGCKERFMNKIF